MRGRDSVARGGWGPAGVALAASIALHVLWVASAPERALVERLPPGAAISLEISSAPPARTQSAELVSSEPPPRVSSPPTVAHARRPGASRAVAVAPRPSSGPELSTSPAEATGSAPHELDGPHDVSPLSVRAATPVLALSPRQVASSLLSSSGGAPQSRASICAPSEAAAPDGCGADEAESLAPARLQHSLEASARTLRHLSPRPPPRLRRQNDGSYRYQGISFNAHVERSGHVAFEEVKGSAALAPLAIVGTFDLTDTIEHELLGKERYSSEKRWFLEQTAALRAELADSARAEERMAGRRALELELERIVSDPATGSEQKRAQVFALWQECGDDEQARQTQRSVEAFVRRRMPQGSRLGYAEDELRHLNETRIGLRAFLPYLDG